MSDDFIVLSERVRHHARTRPHATALIDNTRSLSWQALDAEVERKAASLARDAKAAGFDAHGAVLALATRTGVDSSVWFLAALRVGCVVAPMPTSVTPTQLTAMLSDAQARWFVHDASALPVVDDAVRATVPAAGWLPIDDANVTTAWLLPEGSRAPTVCVREGDAFNIIYSSGTTGTPKGIVQSHGMRALHVARGQAYGYGDGQTTLLATPLYSNTTLVVWAPSIAWGSTTVLMGKFDAERFLQLAEAHRATHTMLVPVQYQRIVAHPSFGARDLSAFRQKFCTSAPFAAALKAEVLQRWPGGLTEFYGMTEGGGTCILDAHEHPDKLHTVGRPSEGHDIRLIDDDARELPRDVNTVGEVVGHSRSMMSGYLRRPDATRAAEWFDGDGKRFIRTGDLGRFDSDGFLVLLDRKKDMIISGGFNVYPSDLEHALRQHPSVVDVAVVGVPSNTWGETPVAFVVLESLEAPQGAPLSTNSSGRCGDEEPAHDRPTEEALAAWMNARVGKTQRVSRVMVVDQLPRSAIGKVLKRTLRETWADAVSSENPSTAPRVG